MTGRFEIDREKVICICLLLVALLAVFFLRALRLNTDHRHVSLSLTPAGERKLRSVVAASLEDVRAEGPALLGALRRAMNGHR